MPVPIRIVTSRLSSNGICSNLRENDVIKQFQPYVRVCARAGTTPRETYRQSNAGFRFKGKLETPRSSK
jgi:hypothetical protein